MRNGSGLPSAISACWPMWFPLCVYQLGTLFTTGAFGIGTVAAVLLVIGFVYLLFRPYHESTTLKVDLKMKKGAMAK